jgi:MFS family permease
MRKPGEILVSGLGILFATMTLGLMAGAALAPRFLKKIKDEKKSLVITQILIGLGIAGSVVWNVFPAATTMFLIHEVARDIFKPLKDAYLHANIPSKERATLISFESIAHHGGGMIGLLLSGFLAEHVGIRVTWGLLGTALIISALLVIKNGYRKE